MKDWIYKEGKIIGHKYFNLQIGWAEDSTSIFDFSVSWSWKRDHAGLDILFSCLCFYFIFQIYDNRHWCESCNNWEEEACYLGS